MIEVMIAAIVGLGLGAWAGSSAKTTPKASQDQMIMCRAMCGKDRVQSFDVMTGECQCISTR